jgi:hypothetical protein
MVAALQLILSLTLHWLGARLALHYGQGGLLSARESL